MSEIVFYSAPTNHQQWYLLIINSKILVLDIGYNILLYYITTYLVPIIRD